MEVLIEFGGDFANLENALDDFERKLRKQYPDLKPADKETIGLVEQLTEKIQKLQDLRKKATKIDDVKSYNFQIKESQKQLDKNTFDKIQNQLFDLHLITEKRSYETVVK